MRLKEIKEGMVIHCKTKDEYRALLEELKRLGYVWWGSSEIKVHRDVCEYCINTTIHIYHEVDAEPYKHITCSSGKGNVEFSDLIIPDLTPAEVLKICNEICHNDRACSNCEMAGNCFSEKGSDYQKVVEICEQWKADHEKKKLELEWVDVCRIIEVQDNGFKKCVNEVDIRDSELPFGYKECIAEMILEDYLRKHRGNYIAVVEHVCRVKGDK